MSNYSGNLNVTEAGSDVNEIIIKAFWLCGILLSSICLLGQAFCYVLIEDCRKYDEKVLTQLTVTRLIYTICEYCIMNTNMQDTVKDLVYIAYIHTDLILVLWMFVFTKNLYEKIVIVFPLVEYNFLLVSLLIWIIPLPVALACPFIITKQKIFYAYYNTYIHIKFIILVINALIFVEIFRVAFNRGVNEARNLGQLMKSAFVAFILVCTTSLHVLVGDLASYYIGENLLLVTIFCVINSYQALAVTFIFTTLVKSTLSMSFVRVISIKLNEIVNRDL